MIRTKFKIYFINLEIIGEEKLYILLEFKNFKNLCNIVKPLSAITIFKLDGELKIKPSPIRSQESSRAKSQLLRKLENF